MKKITVVGAGGAGYSIAAELALNGHQVKLLDLLHDNGKEDFTEHDVVIELTGSIEGTATLHTVTTDAAAAMEGAELVVVSTISNADELAARTIAPFIKSGTVVLLSAGNLGSLIFRRVFDACGIKDVVVGEACGALFSSRRTGENVVFFGNANRPKKAAAYPAKDTEKLIKAFEGIYTFTPFSSILESAFNGPNLLSHISLTVVNAGAIENGPKPYYSFKQAICPSTIGPNSLQERHITEDAPVLGALFLSVAKAVGVETPLYDALIKVAGAINHTDYYAEGRTLENLGLGGLRGVQVAKYFIGTE